MKLSTLALPLAFFAFLGCGDDTSGAGGSGAAGGSAGGGGNVANGGNGGSGGEALCDATFTWLQKDAYKDTAGRTSDLWPPHTTTRLDVTCPGKDGKNLEIVASVFNENHGTTPDAVDANGDVFLVDVKHQTVQGTRADLLALVAAYETCECDPSTKFLSLDSLQDAAAQEVIENVVTYLQTNLTCTSAGGVNALLMNLQNGEIDLVLADLPSCSFAQGTTFSEGLDAALSTFLEASQEALSGYHVCNNDALLQATLFLGFAESGAVQACDGTIAACQGPLWFYTP